MSDAVLAWLIRVNRLIETTVCEMSFLFLPDITAHSSAYPCIVSKSLSFSVNLLIYKLFGREAVHIVLLLLGDGISKIAMPFKCWKGKKKNMGH